MFDASDPKQLFNQGSVVIANRQAAIEIEAKGAARRQLCGQVAELSWLAQHVPVRRSSRARQPLEHHHVGGILRKESRNAGFRNSFKNEVPVWHYAHSTKRSIAPFIL